MRVRLFVKKCKYVALRTSPAAATGKRAHMNATAMIAPAGPQYMRALERANKVRMARAELKRRIATGEIDVADIVLKCPLEVRGMTVADLLVSQRSWGATRCRRVLARLQMSETKTVGSMTERQRQTLVSACRERPYMALSR
jgi:hypothetical protein